jgi:hypothetical protein
MRTVIFSLMILLGAYAIADAQAVYTPEKGSVERAAILKVIRVPVEKAYKQKIVFVIEQFNVQGAWAFISATPTLPSGGPPSVKGTGFEGYEDAYDNNFFGLLRKSGGKWRLVDHGIGCTDVCYADWWRRHKAPKAIFPYTE